MNEKQREWEWNNELKGDKTLGGATVGNMESGDN